MKIHAQRYCTFALVIVAMAFAGTPAIAQEAKTVAGLVVNFGIVPAEVALRPNGHPDAHPANPPPGTQHLLIALEDEKSGRRIGDAKVVLEVTDPHGHVEKKPLLHTQAGGFPDYSELFPFGWSGRYVIRVIITLQPGAKPIQTRFTVDHEI